MIIENFDALKDWLIKELEPICDADPVALAKYVIALAKKDKVEEDLKALCEDQLDVFLGEETKPFVGNLFEALKTKSYLPPPEPQKEEAQEDNPEGKGVKRKSLEENIKSDGEKLQKTDSKGDVGKAKTDDKENNLDSINTNQLTANRVESFENAENNTINTNQNPVQNVDIRNNDERMRSISQDRSMKSMSPAIRPGRHGHHSRRRSSRSPSGKSRHSSRRQPSSRSNRKDDSRDSRNKERRHKTGRKERCRDYEEKGYCMLGETCRFDHGRDPVEVDDRNLPRMLSLAASYPTSQQSNPPNLPVFSGVMPPRQMMPPLHPNSLPPPNMNSGLSAVHVQKASPVDHPPGNRPGQVPIFRPRNSVTIMTNLPSGPISPSVQPPQQPGVVQPLSLPQQGASGEPYNPEEPSIEQDSNVKTDEVSQASSDIKKTTSDREEKKNQDELIQIAAGNVPLTPILGAQQDIFPLPNNTMNPHIPLAPSVMTFPDLVPQAYLPYQNHHILQQQQQQQQQQVQNSTTVVEVGSTNKLPYRKSGTALEIRKIPKLLNTMSKLSEHFQKFGKITKLHAPFDQDPEGALIEFANNRAAYSAYSSTEAILGNRFIKVFWYKPKDNTEKRSAVNAPEGQPASNEEQQQPKKVATSNELRYRNPKTNPALKQMEKKKELESLEKRRQELWKKKQESYEELTRKQKDIFLKLQNKSLTDEEKKKLKKTFKACDAAAKKLKEELQEASKPKPKAPVKQFQNPKKEILDKEIDIIHGNLEGDELIEAKKDLELLKQEAAYEYPRGRGRGRGRGAWRGRGRGRGRGSYGATSVDNRPKRILVTGFDESEKDGVVAHFAMFDRLTQIEEIANTKMIITFPTRRSAEVAATQGAEFQGKQLSLVWFNGQVNSNKSKSSEAGGQQIQRRVTRSLSQSFMDKDLEDELLEDIDKDEEEMLLAGVEDDEEDGDNAVERSWKR